MRWPMAVPPVSRVSTASSARREARRVGALAASLGALEGDVAAGRPIEVAPYRRAEATEMRYAVNETSNPEM